ncbi:MAG TPA: class I SAM-dependent methyltransferase, partial [Cyclobacteriaceae bacterium]|nr:class I SAM-dependent methyltransferase [Cyclobacteriaceae bacterium]
APVYACLSRIVFGKTIERAQHHFLNLIKPHDQVLILGGGSGDLLRTLLKLQPHITVDYIDISPRMIALAKQKTPETAPVNFIVGSADNIPGTYSVVITNFYLDLFSTETLKRIIGKIKCHVQPDGRWLVTDFVSEKWWHKLMLWLMYRFFRIATGIEAKRLPEWQTLNDPQILEIESVKFYGSFIKSAMFRVE